MGVSAATGWKLRILDAVNETAPPTQAELVALRDLQGAH
jgi:hypothetical protein